MGKSGSTKRKTKSMEFTFGKSLKILSKSEPEYLQLYLSIIMSDGKLVLTNKSEVVIEDWIKNI